MQFSNTKWPFRLDENAFFLKLWDGHRSAGMFVLVASLRCLCFPRVLVLVLEQPLLSVKFFDGAQTRVRIVDVKPHFCKFNQDLIEIRLSAVFG